MEASVRKRAFLPKVKTGCLTCKRRKLKCDEAKPHCLRCTSGGRRCDGYRASPSPPAQQVERSMSAWLGSDLEKRSFDFFLIRARSNLSGFFNAPFWSREILQAAIHYPCIRHLVVALGAAYEQFEGKPGCQPGADDDRQFALQQCNYSISHIATLAGSLQQSFEDMCCILTASVLFAVFASLEDRFAEAINHIRSGMRVLSNLDSLGLDGDFPVPIARLRFILTGLYAQIRALINDEARENWNSSDPLASDVTLATAFVNLADAETFVMKLYANTLSFFQKIDLNPPSTPEQLRGAILERDKLGAALRSSCEALGASVSRGTEAGKDKGITVLHLYHTLLVVQLSVHTFHDEEREILFDDAEKHLVQMLEYCKVVLQDDIFDREDTSGQRLYSSGLGVIAPLHMIAARCRNPTVRQEAVDLLRNAHRREWLWDSSLVENIVSTTIELEQSNSSGYTNVPDEFRIREVKIHFEGERGLQLEFISTAQRRYGQRGVRRSIMC